MNEDDRRRGLEHLKQLSDQLSQSGLRRRLVNNEDAAPVGGSIVQPSDGHGLQALQDRYDMELAAHRETTERLLEEKDKRIALLEERIATLEQKVAGNGDHQGVIADR